VNFITARKHEIAEYVGINSIESLRGSRLMLCDVGLCDRELAILGIKSAGKR